jgi:outer membrane protein
VRSSVFFDDPVSLRPGPLPSRRVPGVPQLLASSVLSFLLLLWFAGPLLAQGVGEDPPMAPRSELSLEEALRLAHESNPDYLIQESQAENAHWRSREAWGDLLPSMNASSTLGYTASGERRFQSVELGTQPGIRSSSYNLGLSVTMTGASLLRPSVVRDRNRAIDAEIEGASAGLVDQVTQAYLLALQADEELLQARTELERTRLLVRQAEAQVEVGAATPLDIRRAEIQEGQAEVRLLQAENGIVTARLTLGRVIGEEIPTDVELSTAFELFEPDLQVDRLLSMAMERNPVLRASRSQRAATRTETRMARAQYLPSLSLSAGWTGSVFEPTTLTPLIQDRMNQLSSQFDSCLQDNRIRELLGDPPRDCSQLDPTVPAVEEAAIQQVRDRNLGFPFDYRPQPASFSLQVSIPVFTGFSRQLQIEEARVAERNAHQQVRSEELRLRTEVESAVRAVSTAHRTVALQARIRETAAEELRLALERFRLGLASSIEVADAQANLSEAEREEISAIYDFHISFASLEALVGEALRD